MNKPNKLIGKKIKITSDKEIYNDYKDKTLIVTAAANKGWGYDSNMFPQMLCSFKTLQGKLIPYTLYESEFIKLE